MNLATKPDKFGPVCENCGSLIVVLPTGSNDDPQVIIACGRCGLPRGTLLMLRERSLRRRLVPK
jgi:hypothetical protein